MADTSVEEQKKKQRVILIVAGVVAAALIGVIAFLLFSGPDIEKMQADFEAQRDTLQREIAELEATNISLQDSMNLLLSEANEGKITIDQLRGKMVSLEIRLKKEREKYDELLARYDNLQGKYDEVLAQLKSAKADNSRLMAQNDSLVAVIQNLNNTINTVTEQKQQLKATIDKTFYITDFDVIGRNKRGDTFKKDRIRRRVDELEFSFVISQPEKANASPEGEFKLEVLNTANQPLGVLGFPFKKGKTSLKLNVESKLDKGKHTVKVKDAQGKVVYESNFIVA